MTEQQKDAVIDIATAFFEEKGYLSKDYVAATLDAIAAVMHVKDREEDDA